MFIHKKLLACLLAIFMVGYTYAQPAKLSSATKTLIAEYKLKKNCSLRSGKIEEKHDKNVLTTILLHDGKTIPQETLDSLGIKVKLDRGKIMIVDVPLRNLEKLAEIEGIKLIDTGKKVKSANDKSREASKVDSVHKMKSESEEMGVTDLPTQYRGKGVLVAIIDDEIDLGHPAFHDEHGKSRVLYASITDDDGEEYVYTKENIEEAIEITKDRELSDGHGTHTTGIAAGSTVALSENDPMKKFYGMAPEADILTFDNVNHDEPWVLLSIGRALKIADEAKKPIVINISLAKTSVQLDGTDDFNNELSTLLETYDMKGKIICVAAGNAGDEEKCVQIECNKPIIPGKWVFQKGIMTQLRAKTDDYSIESMTLYGADDKGFGEIIDYYDKNGELLGSTALTSEDCDTTIYILDSQNDTIIINSYEREITSTNRLLQTIDIVSYLDSVTMRTLIYTKEEGVKIDGSTWQNKILDLEDEEWAKPNNNGSLNKMACSDNVISVGSYNTRLKYENIYGDTYSRPDIKELDGITSFSSYCTSHYGKAKPDVLAPGSFIVSSLPVLYEDTIEIVGKSNYDDSDYVWGVNSGTSMSTPAVTGIIALWLQANPNLTTADVREIIRETSTYDSFCQAAKDRAGMGKINALKGLEYIMKNKSAGIEQTDADNAKTNGKYLLPNGQIVIKNGKYLYDATGVEVK